MKHAAFPAFDSPAFEKQFHYDGSDLGARLTADGTVFCLWAPTATRVSVKLYASDQSGEPFETMEMQRQEQGVWRGFAHCFSGTHYTYLVTAGGKTRETADPNARAAGANGKRSMVIDLAATDPPGFRDAPMPVCLRSYRDAVIWEVHVRDFSSALPSTAWRGKYAAFTEEGLTNEAGVPAGIDYLTTLGITHVHLQPVFDFGSVDETKPEKHYNWGYDPENYNVPEGSYSSDPHDGAVRIRELKQLVQTLHQQGIGVIFDVVYNHTFRNHSCLEKTVPGYYYRKNASGDLSNGSGCGNETASERSMVRKYIVDSVAYWAEEYRADGFRFDLMALHDLETMQAVEREVHRINPHAILYGEGWTGGATPLSEEQQANLRNIRNITPTEGAAGGIAVFNDVTRDGLKGSAFEMSGRGWANGAADGQNAVCVAFGISGGKSAAAGWQVERGEVINYVSSHDNAALWDKLQSACPNATLSVRLAMNRLCASVILLSGGIPFFLAGEEFLRTKQGDTNSYASGDSVNRLDWESLAPGKPASEMSLFYARLIALRRTNTFLREAEVVCTVEKPTLLRADYLKNGHCVGVAWFNAEETSVMVRPPAGSLLLWNGDRGVREPVRSEIPVPARAAILLSVPGR